MARDSVRCRRMVETGVRFACLVALAGAAPFCIAEEAPPAKDEAIAKARTYFANLREGKYDACVAASDATMTQALPAEALAGVWAQVVGGFGAYREELAVETLVAPQAVVVDLICKFEASNLAVRITIGPGGKIAGLFFTPTSKGLTYQCPSYADPARFREEPVTVTCGQIELPGTLTLPVAKGPCPAVVLVHGSGPHDEDETIYQRKPFKDLAWGLASRGVAVLRYQKRTQKYGARMDPAAITIDTETVDDAIAAVSLLSGRKDVRADRIFILGHSLGATAAPYMASKESRIFGLVMMAAAARPIHDLVEEQVAYLAQLDGKVDAEEKAQLEEIRAVAARIRDRTFTATDVLLGAPAVYWASLDVMAPVTRAKSFSGPLLVVQGGRDYQTSMADTKIWQKELAGRPNATVKVFKQMDHLMAAGEGPPNPEQYKQPGHIDADVVACIADWILARL